MPEGAAVVSCRQAGLCRCGRHHGVPAHVVNTWPGTRCPCTACIRDRSRTILCPSSRRRASCLRQQRGHVSNERLALAPAPLPGRANRVHVNSQTCRPCVPFLKPCRHVTHTVRVRPEPAPVHVGGQGAGGRLFQVRRWKLFGCDRWSDGVDPERVLVVRYRERGPRGGRLADKQPLQYETPSPIARPCGRPYRRCPWRSANVQVR